MKRILLKVPNSGINEYFVLVNDVLLQFDGASSDLIKSRYHITINNQSVWLYFNGYFCKSKYTVGQNYIVLLEKDGVVTMETANHEQH